MSKLSFRARALDASKPMPIYLAEELPDLPDYTAINRAVPQMPSGMEKEEECEHHLQRAICTGLIIPTPEVTQISDKEFHARCYPADYKMPRQLIHMQPLCLEQEVPEYDMDSEDEIWLKQQRHTELTPLKFEEMMDKLERSSGQTVVTLNEAKLLLGRQDDLVVAVYDYWLNKRLKTQHPLILSVRTESRPGQSSNNPYLAFRRRTEKMQTRKNRKNDESSYEKMLKLRRELSRAATLLELVAKREVAKKELVKLTAAVAERRLAAKDYAGQLEHTVARSVVTPAVESVNSYRRDMYSLQHYADPPRQREKRQYKRRKHRHHTSSTLQTHVSRAETGTYSSSEEEVSPSSADDGPFAFRRKPGCFYQLPTGSLGNYLEDSAVSIEKDKRFRFTLTSVREPSPRCLGFARRRLGRGGRVTLDRIATPLDDLWPSLTYDLKPNEQAEQQPDTQRWLPDPVEVTQQRRYPWRRAFRQHRRRNPALWTSECELTAVKTEQTDFSFNNNKSDTLPHKVDSFNKNNGDISDRKLSYSRKRTLSRRLSESSVDSDVSLQQDETCFQKMLHEINKEWLHFRPKTPPPRQDEEPVSPGRTLFSRCSPVTVEMRFTRPLEGEAPSTNLFKDSSPFTTSGFSLTDIYGDTVEPDISLTDDTALISDNFGFTDSQVDSILSDADLKALTEEEVTKDGKKNVVDLLRPEIADAILEELAHTPNVDSFLSQGAGDKHRAEPAPNRKLVPSNDDVGCTAIRVTNAPCDSFFIDTLVEEKEEKPKPLSPPTPVVKTEQSAPSVPPKMEPKVTPIVEPKIEKKPEEVPQPTLPQAKIIKQSPNRKPPGTPQLLTVAVSESLKVRLHSHILSSSSGLVTLDQPTVVGLMQNGPYVSVAGVQRDGQPTAVVMASGAVSSTSSGAVTIPTGTTVPMGTVTGAVQARRPLVVGSRAVKAVVQRGGLRVPTVVSLAHLHDLKQPLAHYIEIKGGQLAKGPHLVNVVRQQQPTAVSDASKRTVKATPPRPPPRLSVSLDGRHVVRTNIPPAVRHQILKNRVNVTSAPRTTGIPGSVVAELLQKNASSRGVAMSGVSAVGNVVNPATGSTTPTAIHALAAIKARQHATVRPHHTHKGESSSGVSNNESGDTSNEETTTNGARRRHNNTMQVT